MYGVNQPMLRRAFATALQWNISINRPLRSVRSDARSDELLVPIFTAFSKTNRIIPIMNPFS